MQISYFLSLNTQTLNQTYVRKYVFSAQHLLKNHKIILNLTQSRLLNVSKSAVTRVMFDGHANAKCCY